MLFIRNVVPGSSSRLGVVDHKETYGRHILKAVVKQLKVDNCVDLGCGTGEDLAIVGQEHGRAKLFGVDFGFGNKEALRKQGIELIALNIEKDKLPFADNSLDLVIANQIFEHTKELFWVNHEIFRCLKKGGVLFCGTPNVLSLHNRILMLFGFHPTCNKSISAHVRVFSRRDIRSFYKHIGADFCRVESFFGSQFYPFPGRIARYLSTWFPALAFSIFFVVKKTGDYNGEFLKWPEYARLETNFFTGKKD